MLYRLIFMITLMSSVCSCSILLKNKEEIENVVEDIIEDFSEEMEGD